MGIGPVNLWEVWVTLTLGRVGNAGIRVNPWILRGDSELDGPVVAIDSSSRRNSSFNLFVLLHAA